MKRRAQNSFLLRWVGSLAGLAALLILLPAGLVALFHHGSGKAPGNPVSSAITVRVALTRENRVLTLPLEAYVRGVVAAEMPATFPMEALKAQAIAARTNAVRQWLAHRGAGGFDLTDDYRKDQAFATESALRARWGSAYDANMARLNEAVNATAGRILVYAGAPIEAMFFSTSSGYTESSANVFGKNIPYLQAEPSPWDAAVSPHVHGSRTMTLAAFANRLRIPVSRVVAGGAAQMRILAETPSHHVQRVAVGGTVFRGNDFRLALGLDSTDFTWDIQKDTITFHTLGYGHDVGMSQYGANALAASGRSAEQILASYYRGVAIVSLETWARGSFARMQPSNL
jgi:stage II sporulation protein D